MRFSHHQLSFQFIQPVYSGAKSITNTSVILSSIIIQNGDILVPAYLDCHEKSNVGVIMYLRLSRHPVFMLSL